VFVYVEMLFLLNTYMVYMYYEYMSGSLMDDFVRGTVFQCSLHSYWVRFNRFFLSGPMGGILLHISHDEHSFKKRCISYEILYVDISVVVAYRCIVLAVYTCTCFIMT